MNERLWDAVEAFLAAESVELDDLELKGGGKARILRVTVDAEGDLGVGRIAPGDHRPGVIPVRLRWPPQ